MTTFFPSHFRRLWHSLLVVCLAIAGTGANAAEVAVRAALSRGSTVVGDSVQYQIKITGLRRAVDPPEIKVDGLAVRYVGPSESSIVRLNNGVFSSERTVTHVYQVTPEKNGSFTIPAVAIEADGKTYRTESVGLTVQPNTGGGNGGDPQAVGFAEFVLPKKALYLGETIPVELRLYVDARVRWQPVAMPDIAGEGFTKQKMPEPQREQVEKNGKEYDLLIFKTSITPSRAGKITLGPSELLYNARVPRARKGGPRSLLEMFDDDVFGDPAFSSTQQLKAKAGAVELTVKPLPVAGKPADFSGAVGDFQFTAEGSPKEVKIGDPVTMRLRVSGKGNFDRMSAPALQNPSGWRTYPPSSTFKAEDEVGYAGTKTFEMAVVPESRKTAMPVFQFSYFDPLAEKYVTLNSESAALSVIGSAPPAPPAPTVVGSLDPASDSPPPPAPPKPNDILGLRYEPDPARDAAPLYTQRIFWYAQGGLGFSLLLFLGLRLRRPPDMTARALAGLRKEKAVALGRLRGGDLGHVQFFETAARVAQIETALTTGQNPETIDAAAVRASGSLSDDARAAIDDLFSARAELLYAGGDQDEGQVSAMERERILGALGELEKSHARV